MMTADNPSSIKTIEEFIAPKQASLFQKLKEFRFTGQLILANTKGTKWTFYLYLGRLMYATGGDHPVRRWRRNVALHFSNVSFDLASLQQELSAIPAKEFNLCWEYQMLCIWVEKQKISRGETDKMIRGAIEEVLFDLTRSVRVHYKIEQDKSFSTSTQLVLIDADRVIAESWKMWQAWQAAKIADRSPNSAPIIRKAKQLEESTSPKTYQVLKKLLDRKHTLRDLGVQMKRDVVQVTRSLMPYIQSGLVELIEIPDLPSPVTEKSEGDPPKSSRDRAEKSRKMLIACVDDSDLICQTMEKILTKAGYQFLGVSDDLRALAVLLVRKPDFIFLDLVMPHTNGYEICAQLRKLSLFSDTPIVILTGKDGVIDRVRAKLAGSTAYITKPVTAREVLGAIDKYTKVE
ncbi:MAG: response regulator [Prochloraceae cyanobacterium]|nr:response regulator [Prochloraceae cyanobacterium]